MVRPIASLVAFSFVVLAGCSAPASPPGDDLGASSDPLEATVHSSQAPIPSEAGVRPSLGAIQGVVLNAYNESLGGAHVILMGTPDSTDTDKEGRFGFSNLAPADYLLRVDLVQFDSFETSVRVNADTVTRLTIRLAFNQAVAAGFRPHVHDHWSGLERKTLYEGALPWKYAVGSGNVDQQTCVGTGANNGQKAPQGAASCMYVQVPMQTPVPPGTRELEIKIHWKKTDSLKSVTLSYRTANASFVPKWTVVPNSEMRNLSVGPADTDHGHAMYTTWWMIFYVEYQIAGGVSWNQGDLIRQNVGEFQVQIEALKGELWTEDAHRHFWALGPRVVVMDNTTQALVDPQYKRDPQNRGWSSSGNAYFAPSDKTSNLVPPGTTRLEVLLTYSTSVTNLDELVSRKTIAFRTGATDRWTTTMDQLRVEGAASEGVGRTFYELKLKPEEADSVYAKKSNWLFLMANKGQERAADLTNEFGAKTAGTTYKILVVAVNDNYAADFAEGRI